MECIIAAIVLFILVSVPLSAAGFSLWPPSGEETLRQVARRFSGMYYRGTWFQPQRIVFRYGTATVIVKLDRRAAMWLDISIAGTKPGVRLEISEATSLQLLDHRSDLQAAFSLPLEPQRNYIIYAEPGSDIRHVLNEMVVMRLRALHRYGNSTPLAIAVEQTRMVVRKQWTLGLRLVDPIAEFLLLALRFHDHLLLGKEQGIEFVPATQATLEHVKCAICGDPIGDHYVTCRQCSAPHHTECWKYNGACGMYACKELKYDEVRQPAKRR